MLGILVLGSVKVIIFCEHKFGILKNSSHILLVIGAELALLGQHVHPVERLLNLSFQFCLGCRFAGLLPDGFDDRDVVFVEVVGEERVGIGEILASVLEGLVLGYNLHR